MLSLNIVFLRHYGVCSFDVPMDSTGDVITFSSMVGVLVFLICVDPGLDPSWLVECQNEAGCVKWPPRCTHRCIILTYSFS